MGGSDTNKYSICIAVTFCIQTYFVHNEIVSVHTYFMYASTEYLVNHLFFFGIIVLLYAIYVAVFGIHSYEYLRFWSAEKNLVNFSSEWIWFHIFFSNHSIFFCVEICIVWTGFFFFCWNRLVIHSTMQTIYS